MCLVELVDYLLSKEPIKDITCYATLAQLVEQLIRNEQVIGSNPMGGSFYGWIRLAKFPHPLAPQCSES